jgi:hypothetical protein
MRVFMADAGGQPVVMQCLEVWGGNQAVDNGVVMPGLDAWVFSRPHGGDSSGGDIHYVSSCSTGRIARLLVADVAGHGESAAGTARELRELMRRYMNYVDQARLVRGINAEFSRLARAGVFATAVAVTYWTPTDELTITNAGHPRPLVYRARERRWQVVSEKAEAQERRGGEAADLAQERAEEVGSPRNLPLGVLEPTGYDVSRLRLGAGDLLMLYTDSLVEARGRDGRMIGEAGLIRVLSALDAGDARGLTAGLLAEIGRGGGPPGDDVTVLLVRPNALKPRGSFVQGLISGAVIARESLKALVSGKAPPLPEASGRNVFGAFFDGLNRVRR